MGRGFYDSFIEFGLMRYVFSLLFCYTSVKRCKFSRRSPRVQPTRLLVSSPDRVTAL